MSCIFKLQEGLKWGDQGAFKLSRKELNELGELDNFVRTFRQRRYSLGFSQKEAALAISRLLGNYVSQRNMSKFERFTMSYQDMRKLRPYLEKWLEDPETWIYNSGAPKNTFENLFERKKRKHITSADRDVLINAFKSNPDSSEADRKKLANSLNLDEEVVRAWFHKKLLRLKKDTS